MRDRVTRRPMPVEESIHWKPLRDPHYVVASIQPGGSGHHPILVEQPVLARIQEIARTTLHQRAIGLLIGQRFECPSRRSMYVLISSLVERTSPVTDENTLTGAVEDLVLQFRCDSSMEIAGWYCAGQGRSPDLSSRCADAHSRCFRQPWHTALLVPEGATSGAFVLRDRLADRWFQAPFYEVTHPARLEGGAKATCITWADYVTTDSVVPLSRAHASAFSNHTPNHAQMGRAITPRRSLWRSLFPNSASRSAREIRPAPSHRNPVKQVTPVPDGDSVTRPPSGSGASGGRHSVALRPQPVTPITDSDDTSSSDTPYRYIELARAEGFFVTMEFEASDANEKETLWLLNEPYSGILLTLVTDDSQIIDASIHYNLHVEELETLNARFPEHRDLESRTAYVREWCTDRLRARCRRLRASGALERQWKVAGPIYLLTPAEWESSAINSDTLDAELDTLEALNRRRLDSLPEAIRRQFRLSGPGHESPRATYDENAG